MDLDRQYIGHAIAEKIKANVQELHTLWLTSKPFRYFILDDLLSKEEILKVAAAFPEPARLMLRSTIRERKRVGVDVKNYDPCIGEYLFAFQHPEVIKAISKITDLIGLEADPTLYASGISVMGKGDFLNPHLDNSHDGDGNRYRVLNLLYYISPNWKLENGGNFELWDPRITHAYTILSKFNRLVVIETNEISWHSVSKVIVDDPRYCISNYYFSHTPPGGIEYSNVTTSAGRPEEPFKRFVLKADGLARNVIGRIFPKLVLKTKHRITKA